MGHNAHKSACSATHQPSGQLGGTKHRHAKVHSLEGLEVLVPCAVVVEGEERKESASVGHFINKVCDVTSNVMPSGNRSTWGKQTAFILQ